MNATSSNGPDNGGSRHSALHTEIAELKRQRNDCQTALAECQRQNRELKAENTRLRGSE